MKARVLVLAVNDGDEYTELGGIADENVMTINPGYLAGEVERVRRDYGSGLEGYGFVDIEIPDEVIAKVLRRTANAGVVTATAVDSEGSN